VAQGLSESGHAGDVREEKADVLHANYDRIVVEGRIVSVRLTPDAGAHGMALALPQVVVARPTGVERAITTWTIPIEGRDEWEAVAGAALQPA
jgi:hypothetical protein